MGMFLTTLSFYRNDPGVGAHAGVPALSALPGQFLFKDIVLLGASVFTAGEAFSALTAPKKRIDRSFTSPR